MGPAPPAQTCCSLLWASPPGRHDLFARRGALLPPAHRPRARGLAVREQLDLAVIAPTEPRLGERFRRDFAAHFLEIVEANYLGFLTKWIREATLRQAACDRHLSALERRLPAARPMMPGARLDALVSLAGRLSLAGPGAAPDALPLAVRAASGHQVVEPDPLDFLSLLDALRHGSPHSSTTDTSTRCRTCLSCPTSAG